MAVPVFFSHVQPRTPELRAAFAARRALGALGDVCPGDDWSDWCAGGGAVAYGGRMDVCTDGACGGGWKVGFQPPWTDLGKLIRVAKAGAWPDASELEPEELVKLPILNPARFAYIVALSKFVSAIPLLKAAGVVLGALGMAGVEQVPFSRGLSKLSVGLPVPMGSYAEWVALTPPGVAFAVSSAFAKGGWDRVWTVIVQP